MAAVDPIIAAKPIAAALREDNGGGHEYPDGQLAVFCGPHRWRTTRHTAPSSNQKDRPHDTLPSRPICVGPWPDTKQERSG